MFSVLETTGKDLSWIDHDKYVLADSTNKALDYIKACLDTESTKAWDIESTGLSLFVDKIVGFSLSYEEGSACYVPLHHRHDQNVDLDKIFEQLSVLLTTHPIVAHNSGFDWARALKFWGVDVNIKFCTLTEAWLINSDLGPKQHRKKLALEQLVLEKLGLETLSLKEVTEQGSHDFSLVPTSDAIWYAGPDSDCCLRLHNKQMPQIKALGLEMVYGIEAACLKPSADMTNVGLGVNKPLLKSFDISTELMSIEEEVARTTGISVNLNSPDQVAQLLFEKLGLPKIRGDSTDDTVLQRLNNSHPSVPLIRDHRDWSKLKSGFIDKLGEATAEDERLHLEYCASGTRSGRFSSHGGIGRGGKKIKINGQTWPNGKKINVREALIPADGSIWVSMDYEQIEYKIVAYESQQKELLQMIADGWDFHVATASLFLGVPLNQVTPALRKRGKTLNFGVVYGMTAGGLAARLGVQYKEGAALINRYFEKLDKVRKLIDKVKKFTLDNGFVKTKFGRIRWFRDIRKLSDKHRDALLGAAWNTSVQGGAADINKIGLARVYKASKALPVDLMSTVHDECNLQAQLSSSPREVLPILVDAMTIKAGLAPGWLDFPVSVEVGTSYGTLQGVPAELLDRFDKWDDLLAEVAILEEKKKLEQKKTSAEVVSRLDTTYVPQGLTVQSVKRITPSIRVSFDKPEAASSLLPELMTVCSMNHGLYRIYIDVGDGSEFCVDDVSVNPTDKFILDMKQLGMEVEVFSAPFSKNFDASSLTF